ncbi:UbiA family prenyltransferase [Brevundimonas sp. VNH65]|uniref:UbiA family prenyltransferase n=1 Tax=Brevundimonas sp. VNH65 TaxID=3400917 RepID=UPI003C0A5DE0
MSNAPLPDAARLNWVDARAPEALKPWLKLGRFDRPIGIWLLLLPGWQGIALALAAYRTTPGLYHLWLFVAFAIGACLMRAAGCAFNDIVDRDIDAKVSRTAGRPIASGRISVKQAWAFIVACSLVSLAILLTLNLTAVLLGVASLALVAAYPFMKRITWWPQAWLGMTFNWGALMGFAAAFSDAERVRFMTEMLARVGVSPGTEVYFVSSPIHNALPAIFLWLGGVFWTLGYDTIYALQDIEDDAMVGVKSSARRLGAGVGRGVAVFYGLAILFAGLAALNAGLGPVFWLGLIAYAAHLFMQVRRLRLDDAALALKLFKSNREAGLILLAAIALGSLSL